MEETQHYYKRFPGFEGMSVAEDMNCEQTVWLFSDMIKQGRETLLSVAHIIRADGNDEDSVYYGKNVRLSLNERLLPVGENNNEAEYYVDALGDKYLIYNNMIGGKEYKTVNGYEYTTIEPSWLNGFPLYSEIKQAKLNLCWLTKGNVVKGYNKDGYLVVVGEKRKRLYYIYRTTGSNLLKSVSDYSGQTSKLMYYFYYNDVEETGNYHLNKIYDYINSCDVKFEYDSDNPNLSKLIKISHSLGETFNIGYKGDIIDKVTSSDGYTAEYSKSGSTATLKIKSRFSQVPGDSTPEDDYPEYSKWIIAYSGNNCTITYDNGDKEHYNFTTDNRVNYIYAKESGGKVTEAYETFVVPHSQNGIAYATQECLYVPYAQFEIELGEMDITTLNGYEQPDFREITLRRIAVNSAGIYSTANIRTDYLYNEDRLCLKETTTATLKLNNGKEESYTQVTEYEYDDGELVKKTSYVGDEYTKERSELIETYGREDSADGTYQTRSSRYRAASGNRRYRTEENYDSYGRKMSEKDPSGNYETKYTYYNNGLIYGVNQPGYPVTYRRYDNYDNLRQVYFDDYDEEGYYIDVGNLLERINGELVTLKGNDHINFVYDEKRRLKSVNIAGNTGSKTFSYSEDTAKETVIATNENGEVIKCEVAKDGSYEKLYYNNVLQLQNDYNTKGQLTIIRDVLSGANATCTYNALGQLTSYTEKQDNSTKVKHSYAYDEYGNLSAESISGQVSRTYGYEYEAKSDRRFKGMTFGGISEEVEYDNLDRITSKTVKLNGTVLFTKTYEYYDVKQETFTNATTLPKSIKYMRGGLALQSVTYGYNTMTGQLNEITVDGQSAKYQYIRNQLFREDNQALNKSQQFYYANDWNMSNKVTGAYNPDGGVNGTYTYYNYSGDKLMTYANQPCVYDAMGNPTTYRGKTATWKGRQMLSLGGNTFTYDGRGRRTSKNSLTFLYDSNGRIIKQSNGLEFFYDFEGIAAVKYNGNTYLYVTDAQGNVIALIDKNGNVVVQYYYDAWGNHTVSGSNTTLQTRYYDPEVGRFLNRDAVTYADPETIGGLNLYAYCLNNPVMGYDPEGTFDWDKLWGWIAASAIIVAGIALIVTPAVLSSALIIASNGLAATAMVGAGVGVIAGVSGSIAAQGGLSNIANIDPWSVFKSGAIGGVIGTISGVASYGVSLIGRSVGSVIGNLLANTRHLNSGKLISEAFGLTVSSLMTAGQVLGGAIGGSMAGMAANYTANVFVEKIYGVEYIVDNPNYVRSGILKLFKWLF